MGDSERTDGLYVEPRHRALTLMGSVTIDPGGGCGTTVLDERRRPDPTSYHLWIWTNTPGPTGAVGGEPANGCAVQSASCPKRLAMAGLSVIGHLDAATRLRGVSPNDDRLYRVVPGNCPSNGNRARAR